MPNETEKAGIDTAVNALQVAVMPAARIETDHDELRRSIIRAAESLRSLIPLERQS